MPVFINLLRAEWQKVTSNYLLTGFLVWVLPIGIGAFYVIALLGSLFADDNSAQLMATTSSGQWTTDMLSIWGMITSYPNNLVSRLLPMAFIAATFAGEYQWAMWKNLIPRSQRRALIFAKYVTLLMVELAALFLCSVIIGAGQGLLRSNLGLSYGPAATSATLLTFLGDYGREVLLSTIALTILISYAALAAMLTRSILGGLLAGFGFSLLESLSVLGLSVLGAVFNNPTWVNLYQFTPTYNIDNLRAWLVEGQALAAVTPEFTAAPALWFSIILLSLWVLGLLGLTILIFERQDITS